ncbi:MAG: NAD-dependent epimerase/dehydratase family protein [Myxococcales bacterium]|nr:NAD-dependent epimerase/dehydratase family protein [Myxococcales bacterium]
MLADGHQVTVLDNLAEQVHGPTAARPAYLAAAAELVRGDVRDRALVERLVPAADVVVHLAAAVGLAQSMYEIERFVDVNCRGTAVVLEAAVQKGSRVRKIVVASSMSLYGEGRCRCVAHGAFDPSLRSSQQLARHDFDVRCPVCDAIAEPIATPETARLQPTTVYAVSKRDQEELALAVGAAYRLPVVALRLFNVYGPRQSLSNPYTGVAAIFSSRLLTGHPPIVFEDGRQTRDFTHVSDVAEAFHRVVTQPGADGMALNVGAGRAFTLLELGELLAREIGVGWRAEISGRFREGDIRHCCADGTRLAATVGFRPRVDFHDGVCDLIAWVRGQAPRDDVAQAVAQLEKRGLIR